MKNGFWLFDNIRYKKVIFLLSTFYYPKSQDKIFSQEKHVHIGLQLPVNKHSNSEKSNTEQHPSDAISHGFRANNLLGHTCVVNVLHVFFCTVLFFDYTLCRLNFILETRVIMDASCFGRQLRAVKIFVYSILLNDFSVKYVTNEPIQISRSN